MLGLALDFDLTPEELPPVTTYRSTWALRREGSVRNSAALGQGTGAITRTFSAQRLSNELPRYIDAKRTEELVYTGLAN
jgi:hypothetical protein